MKVDFGGQLQAVTDKDGRYQLLNVSAGSYTIKVKLMIFVVLITV